MKKNGVGGFSKILRNFQSGSWKMLTTTYKVGVWSEKRPKVFYAQACRKVGAGGAAAPPNFGRSEGAAGQRRAALLPAPQIFRPDAYYHHRLT